jgi:hypothetical protein
MLAKFSILFFFRRMVIGLPTYMRAWWACFVMVLLLYLASIASNFLTCRPLAKYWSVSVALGIERVWRIVLCIVLRELRSISLPASVVGAKPRTY